MRSGTEIYIPFIKVEKNILMLGAFSTKEQTEELLMEKLRDYYGEIPYETWEEVVKNDFMYGVCDYFIMEVDKIKGPGIIDTR